MKSWAGEYSSVGMILVMLFTVFIIESVSRYCRKNWYRGRAENEQTD